MHHVAIMKKSWGLIPKILSGEKTIESRWYQTRRAPWGKVNKGDTIYFKNSGEPVAAKAEVSRVYQFEVTDIADIKKILGSYGKQICLAESNPETWGRLPRYTILMELENPKALTPFDINKRGFGSAAAWLSVPSISQIMMSPQELSLC